MAFSYGSFPTFELESNNDHPLVSVVEDTEEPTSAPPLSGFCKIPEVIWPQFLSYLDSGSEEFSASDITFFAQTCRGIYSLSYRHFLNLRYIQKQFPKIKESIKENLHQKIEDAYKIFEKTWIENNKSSKDTEELAMRVKIIRSKDKIIEEIRFDKKEGTRAEHKLIEVVRKEAKKLQNEYKTKSDEGKTSLESKKSVLIQFEEKLESEIKNSIKITQPSFIFNEKMKRSLDRFCETSQIRSYYCAPIKKPNTSSVQLMLGISIVCCISLILSLSFFQRVNNEWSDQKSILDKIITPCAGNKTCSDYYLVPVYHFCNDPDAGIGEPHSSFDLADDCAHGILAICKAACDLLHDLLTDLIIIITGLVIGSVGVAFFIGLLRYFCFTPKNEFNNTSITNFPCGKKEAANDLFSAFAHTSFFKTQNLRSSIGAVRKTAIRTKLKLFDYSVSSNESQEKLLIQCMK